MGRGYRGRGRVVSVLWNDIISQVLGTEGTSEAVLLSLTSKESMAATLPILRAAVERQGYQLRFRTLSEPRVKVALWVVPLVDNMEQE